MTTITITPDWRIKSDAHSWHLQKRAVAKTGKLAGRETWESRTYHTTASSALNHAAEMNLRLADAESFAEALAEVERFTAALSRSLSPKYGLIEP